MKKSIFCGLSLVFLGVTAVEACPPSQLNLSNCSSAVQRSVSLQTERAVILQTERVVVQKPALVRTFLANRHALRASNVTVQRSRNNSRQRLSSANSSFDLNVNADFTQNSQQSDCPKCQK